MDLDGVKLLEEMKDLFKEGMSWLKKIGFIEFQESKNSLEYHYQTTIFLTQYGDIFFMKVLYLWH